MQNKKFTIYKATNSINGKVYIGFDSNWPKRKSVHKSSSKNKSNDTKFYRAIRKYGWDAFEWHILYQSENQEHTLNVMESFFIEKYDSFNNGYNSTLGGDGVFGLIVSEETKKKISEKNKIPKPQTKEHIEKRIKSGLETRKLKKKAGHSYSPKKETIEKQINTKIKNNTTGKGIPKSKSHIESMKNRPQDTIVVTCPFCGKSGDYKNMKRWHMDRCKENPNRLTDKDQKSITCNKCGFTSIESPNFYRYHNNNCKSIPQISVESTK